MRTKEMNLQAILNQDALNCFPKIQEHIKNANSLDANQMRCYTIQTCCNTTPCVANKSIEQIEKLQDDLISFYKEQTWIEE